MEFLASWKDKILKDDISTLAAALAFFTTFSLAPLLLLLLGLLSSTGLKIQNQLVHQINALLGQSVADAVIAIIEHQGQDRSIIAIANWSGVLTLLISASFVFAQLQASLNIIFEVTVTTKRMTWWQFARNYLLRRLFCMGIVLTFVFLSIVSLIVSTAISFLFEPSGETIIRLVHTGSTFAIFTLLFAAIFRWMPDCKVSNKASLLGGAITAILFDVGKILIGLYLGRAGLGSPYGAAGSFIVLLVWVYYSSVIIFSGAELSSLLNKKSEAQEEIIEKLSA